MARFATQDAPVWERRGFLIEYTPESLRILRRYRQLTQAELGRQIASSGDYISELERGRSQPSVDLMGRLGESLNVIFFK